MIDSEQDGVGYRVTIGKEKVTEDLSPLNFPFSEKEVFSITPVIAGAGVAPVKFLLAVALVALTLVPGGCICLYQALLPQKLDCGWLFDSKSGIATAISPQPNLDSTLDESAQLESFSFSNVVNTSRQGMPCPIAYGRLFVGSAVLSSGLDVDQVQV